MYKFSKKYWFNDFGAYAKADHGKTARAKTQELVNRAKTESMVEDDLAMK